MKIFKYTITENDTLSTFIKNHSNVVPKTAKTISGKGSIVLCQLIAFCITVLKIKESPELTSVDADRLYEDIIHKLFLEVF